jgi:hypothetical protein
MAIVTRHVVDFDGGTCSWEYDYDNVALRLTQIRCTNVSQYNTRAIVTVMSNGRVFTHLVAPVGTDPGTLPADGTVSPYTQNLPTGAQTRLDITIDARGRVNGIDHHFEWGPSVV